MTQRTLQDQTCGGCGAKVTAKQLARGEREFREYILIGYLDRVKRTILCTPCEVKVCNVMEGHAKVGQP